MKKGQSKACLRDRSLLWSGHALRIDVGHWLHPPPCFLPLSFSAGHAKMVRVHVLGDNLPTTTNGNKKGCKLSHSIENLWGFPSDAWHILNHTFGKSSLTSAAAHTLYKQRTPAG